MVLTVFYCSNICCGLSRSIDPLLFSFLSSGLARHRVPPWMPFLTCVCKNSSISFRTQFRSLFAPYTSLLVRFWSWNYNDWFTLHSVSQIMDPCWQDKIQDLFLFVFLIHKVHKCLFNGQMTIFFFRKELPAFLRNGNRCHLDFSLSVFCRMWSSWHLKYWFFWGWQ